MILVFGIPNKSLLKYDNYLSFRLCLRLNTSRVAKSFHFSRSWIIYLVID